MSQLKSRIRSHQKTFGMWLDLGSPAVAEAAVFAGFRFVLIDNEHGPASLETSAHMLRAIEAAGGEAIVRAPANDRTYLKRLLELGVHNLLIPQIDTVEEAEAAVRACRYPPHGRRGYAAPVVRGSRYGVDRDYAGSCHQELCLMVQIESVGAVDLAADIAAVDGIDLLFVGPNDLAGSMGLLEQTGHADVVAQIRRVEEAARAQGVGLGNIPLPDEDASALFARGYDLVMGASDVALMMTAYRAAAQAQADALG